MTRPNVTITDCKTQETIIREMNDEEYAQYLVDLEHFNKIEAQQASE